MRGNDMKKGLIALFVLLLPLFVGCDSKATNGTPALEAPRVDEQTDTEPNKEEKVTLSKGKIDGDVYTNEFLGLTFTKPKSWVYCTDEEVAALINLVPDDFLGGKLNEVLENNMVVVDMIVRDVLSGTNFNVIYENLYKTFSSNITIEQYIDALKMQLVGNPSMTVTFPDTYETVKLGKTEFTKVVCQSTALGNHLTQVFYLHKVDHYMCSIVVTLLGDDTIAEIEAMFK